MRSVAGCQTCRRRKLKCDEKRPECGQCRKASRTCVPGELVFRHQQNSSVARDGGDLDRYYSKRGSFDGSNTWLEIPKKVTFVNEDASTYSGAGADHNSTPDQDPTSDDASSPAHPQSSADGDTANESKASPIGASPASAASASSSLQHFDNPVLQKGAIPFRSYDRPPSNIDFILNPAPSAAGLDGGMYFASLGRHDNPLAVETSLVPSLSRISQPAEPDPEVAFLLRQFSEYTGRWLDLYFLDAYFECDVPLKALSCPLLKYAACAYAAKHLSRTTRPPETPAHLSQDTKPISTTLWPGLDTANWDWYSTKYYSKAINLLLETLQKTHNVDGSPKQYHLMEANSPGHRVENYAEIADETLAAMDILCNFEFMSASDTQWTRHLTGTMLLLDLKQSTSFSSDTSKPSKARTAIFWNFFRQDMFAACILGSRTRLDPEDLRIWRAAGLLLDEAGFVRPSNRLGSEGMRDDMISNALIWILGKIFNYVSRNKECQEQMKAPSDQWAKELPSSVESPQALTDRWNRLNDELKVWFDGLTDSYRPCARIEPPLDAPATNRPVSMPEIWFTSALCGSTVQSYHLARILLLTNKPHSSDPAFHSSATSDFMSLHCSVAPQLRYHSREIFGIALSSPATSIFLHQTQTMYIAALCLEQADERRLALDILYRVKSDLGWETDYRTKDLLQRWGWRD